MRRPGMEPRDIYKLLYQGVRGPEHLISSSTFIERLRAEWEFLDLAVGDPMWESIRPDGKLLRLNLRPYKSRQVGIDLLITPLLETAWLITGDLAKLQSTWLSFTQLCEHEQLTNFNIPEVHRFNRWLEKMEFPAVHHSEPYRREYQPAYRLIAVQYVTELGYEIAG